MIHDHHSFHNVRVSGESRNAGAEAAEEMLATLDKLIEEQNYLPELILIWMKLFPFWKQIPGRPFIHNETRPMPNFKASKDRMTA